MRIVEIRSNTNPHVIYEVTLNDDGKAIRCTCEAGHYGNACCHLERAELSDTFMSARRLLGAFGMSQELFLAKFRTTVRTNAHLKNYAVNAAIRKTIEYAARCAKIEAARFETALCA